GHQLAVGGIVGEIVELRYGAYSRGEGRMGGHLTHSFAVQQHGAAVAQAAHIVIATPSHTASSLALLVHATGQPKASTFIGLGFFANTPGGAISLPSNRASARTSVFVPSGTSLPTTLVGT